jgi:hypothetical protein
LYWLVLGIAVAAYYVLQSKIPLFADDYCRARPELDLQTSLKAAWREYLNWSGRFPVMTLNWVVFSMGKAGIAMLNIASAGMLLLLCRTAIHTRIRDHSSVANSLVLICLLFLWWMTPDSLGEVALWKSGTLQYFWATVLAVYCLAPVLQLTVYGSVAERRTTGIALFAMVCLAAGMWLEHVSVSVSATWLLLLVINRWVLQRQVPTWIWLGWLLWTLGAVVLVAAPGNYARAEVLGEHNVFTNKLIIISGRLLDKVDPKLWLTYMVFLSVSLIEPASRAREQLLFSLIFVVLAVFCAISLAAAPNVMFFDRIAYPSEFFLVLAVVFALPVHVFATPIRKRTARIQRGVIIVTCLVMATILIIDYRNVFNAYSHIYQQNEIREKRVAQAKRDQADEVFLKPLYFNPSTHTGNGEINAGRLFARDVTKDSKHWLNSCYERAHGVKRVVLEP